MKVKQELIDLIKDRLGVCNTDIISGWEEGLKGKRRVNGILFDRYPPEHLTGQRYADWRVGHDAAARYKASLVRITVFLGDGPDGPMRVERKGWVSRAPIVTRMAREGAYGDVSVFFMESGKIKRQVKCCI